jgi:lysophospholipase L1-like esterase
MKKIFCLITLCLFTTTLAWSANPFEKEIARYEAQDLKTPPPAKPLLFVGSSTIGMWKSAEKEFSSYQAINRGFGGSQVSDMIYFKDRVILNYKPRALVIYSGDNDLASSKTPDKVASDYKTLIDSIYDHGERPIILLAVKISPARASLEAKMRVLNTKLKALTETYPRIQFIDFNDRLTGTDGKPDLKYFLSDKLHLSAEGYKILNSLTHEHLKQINW